MSWSVRVVCLGAFALGVFSPAYAWSCPRPGACSPLASRSASVDPRLDLARSGAWPGRAPAGAWVTVRGPAAAEPGARESLRARGVRWSGGSAQVWSAWATWSGIEALARTQGVTRIESARAWVVGSPLELTTRAVGAPQVRREIAATGEGARVGLIDSGVDVFHPALFYADGGEYAWIDADSDGRFIPGVDAIDLDEDGVADANETARVLPSADVEDLDTGVVTSRVGGFDPASDWIYVDLDGDFERDVGVDAGFDEFTPAFGEPAFVVRDANGDGLLSPGERLLRLGTSKVRAYTDVDRTYVRGEDLIESANAPGVDASFHGTAVAGIIAGGQPEAHERVGVAPGAELVVYGFGGQSALGEFDALINGYVGRLAEDGVVIAVHEWADPLTRPLDGSSNLEAALDASRASGVAHVVPAGNLASARKHTEVELAGGDRGELAFDVVGEGFGEAPSERPYELVLGSLQWDARADLELTLTSPEGERISLDVLAPQAELDLGRHRLVVSSEETTRGFRVVYFYLFARAEGELVSPGRWAFALERVDAADDDVRIHARVGDVWSVWSEGVGWEGASTTARTATYPSTADSAFVVAALSMRTGEPTLRGYSGRGPRVDGAPLVDLGAPDSPYAPLGVNRERESLGYSRSWFVRFGGTSGAAPHVAGALALLAAREPAAGPRAWERALRDAARPLDGSPRPDDGWGWGALDVYGAVFGRVVPDNTAPRAALEVTPMSESMRLRLDATASEDVDSDTLRARFDVDDDGIYERGWGALVAEIDLGAMVDAGARTSGVARAEVRDPSGAVADVSAPWAFAASPEGEDAGGSDAGGEPSTGQGCCAQRPAGAPAPLAPMLGLVFGALVWSRRRALLD